MEKLLVFDEWLDAAHFCHMTLDTESLILYQPDTFTSSSKTELNKIAPVNWIKKQKSLLKGKKILDSPCRPVLQ